MKRYFVAWWNVENLFDIEHAPDRPEWLERKLKQELSGWTQDLLARKLDQLALVIRALNGGQGPDLLGLAEVENARVLQQLVAHLDLPGRKYQVAHHDGGDKRGIDVAFVYDANLFAAEEQFSRVILVSEATRDLFQVNLRTTAGHLLIVIGNHWPARMLGELESEPFRIMAAETLRYWHERIQEVQGELAPVLVMGDFNDEPFNRSMIQYALSTNSVQRVQNAHQARLFNLMWPALGQGLGTCYYNRLPMVIDQFLVSRGLLDPGQPLSVDAPATRVEAVPQMVAPGAYAVPLRFGQPSDELNCNGFSDHFPISTAIVENG